MKLEHIIAAALLLLQPVQAATKAERKFERLTQKRDKSLASAAEPINRRYQSALEALLRKATQDNDAEAVLKIKQATERLAASDSRHSSKLVGVWHVQNLADQTQATYDIQSDNTVKMDGRPPGKWEVKEKQLIVRYDHGGFEKYDLPAKRGLLKGTNDLGQSLTMTRDNQ